MQPYNTDTPTLWVLDASTGKVHAFTNYIGAQDSESIEDFITSINELSASDCAYILAPQNVPYYHHKVPSTGVWQ
jgi:hypothetical protein